MEGPPNQIESAGGTLRVSFDVGYTHAQDRTTRKLGTLGCSRVDIKFVRRHVSGITLPIVVHRCE